jgi:hypothetical protein
MQYQVDSTLKQAADRLRALVAAQQLPYAASRALNRTALDIQRQVRDAMPTRFKLRQRAFILGGIRVKFADKRNLQAEVYSRDDFMGLQEHGGTKLPFGNFIAIPTTLVRRTPMDNIRKADRPKALGDKAERRGHVTERSGSPVPARQPGRP